MNGDSGESPLESPSTSPAKWLHAVTGLPEKAKMALL